MRWNPPWMSRSSLAGIHSTDQYGIRWVLIPAKKPFLMAETPVTQEQYQRVMGVNPSYFRGPRRPVERVNFREAEVFSSRVGGRLPTEGEWYFAAMGGGTADPYGDPLEIGWFYENSGRRTHPVKRKRPNGYGLYDMLGNVLHWTSPSEGIYRVIRGGSWNNSVGITRASFRRRLAPDYSYNSLGFRPVKDL